MVAGGDGAALIAVRAGMELAISIRAMVAGRHFLAEARYL
jgi:thiamine monophosphate kinase